VHRRNGTGIFSVQPRSRLRGDGGVERTDLLGAADLAQHCLVALGGGEHRIELGTQPVELGAIGGNVGRSVLDRIAREVRLQARKGIGRALPGVSHTAQCSIADGAKRLEVLPCARHIIGGDADGSGAGAAHAPPSNRANSVSTAACRAAWAAVAAPARSRRLRRVTCRISRNIGTKLRAAA